MKRLALLIIVCILSLGMTQRSEVIVNAQYYLNQSYGAQNVNIPQLSSEINQWMKTYLQ